MFLHVLLWITTLALTLQSSTSFSVVSVPTTTTTSTIRRTHPGGGRRPILGTASFRLFNQLNTALEWLCDERYQENAEYYQSINWYDPSQPISSSSDEENDGGNAETTTTTPTTTIMPLYPLPATYLPAPNINHTLNNVEPRNVKMALDLIDNNNNDADDDTPPLFCVVLRAADTGRIASVGTILKIIDYDIQKDYDDPDKVARRIRLTCQAQGIADICEIENPNVFSKENRIRRLPEYLKARVRVRENKDDTKNNNNNNDDDDDDDDDELQKQQRELLAQQLLSDFQMVQLLYQLDVGGSEGLPPGALPQLGNAMPSWQDYDFMLLNSNNNHYDDFWKAAQDWQSVCYTIRQGRQSMVNTERNERMIAAATAKGGPLKLPVHMEDLDPSVRREILELENDSYEDYLKLDMEPCLDFQALISLSSSDGGGGDCHIARMELLSKMISRERQRLEVSAKQPRRRQAAKEDDPDLSFEF